VDIECHLAFFSLNMFLPRQLTQLVEARGFGLVFGVRCAVSKCSPICGLCITMVVSILLLL